MSSALKTEAVVLSSKVLPSSDVVYTFFTAETGKIRVYAKGIKKLTSRRKPHLQTGNLVQAEIRKGKDTNYLQETTLISAFSQIKNTPERLNWLYTYLFLIDRLLPEEQGEGELYIVLKKLMIDLSGSADPLQLFVKTANKTFAKLGFSSEKLTLSEIQELFTQLTSQKLPLYTI